MDEFSREQLIDNENEGPEQSQRVKLSGLFVDIFEYSETFNYFKPFCEGEICIKLAANFFEFRFESYVHQSKQGREVIQDIERNRFSTVHALIRLLIDTH